MFKSPKLISLVLMTAISGCGDYTSKNSDDNKEDTGFGTELVRGVDFKNTATSSDLKEKGHKASDIYSKSQATMTLNDDAPTLNTPLAPSSLKQSFLVTPSKTEEPDSKSEDDCLNKDSEGQCDKESDQSILDIATDVFSGEFGCEQTFSKINQLFNEQKDELKSAVNFLDIMREEKQRKNHLEVNKIVVKEIQKENTAASFEYSSDEDGMFGTVFGAANEQIIAINHNFSIKDEKVGKLSFKTGFGADLSKNTIEYAISFEGKSEGEDGLVPVGYNVSLTTEQSQLPKITLKGTGQFNKEKSKFSGTIRTLAPGHLSIKSLLSEEGNEDQIVEFEIKKSRGDSCEIKEVLGTKKNVEKG